MKHIYYTNCQEGKSVTGSRGQGARAASAGIPYSSLEKYALYAISSDKKKSVNNTEELPVCLRYCEARELEHPIIVHAVYASAHRSGNYFSHLLTDLENKLTPVDAVCSWNSSYWQRQDDATIDSILPDMRIDFNDDTAINKNTFADFFNNDTNKKLFRFLLHAWLHRDMDKKSCL